MRQPFLSKFIEKRGRPFKIAPLPSDIVRGKIGDCFDHCMLQAMRSNGKYTYCEGIVKIKNKWIHHAWLSDKTGTYAYDPTWYAVDNRTGELREMPSHVFYLGAVLDLHYVMEFVSRTQYKSPIANYDKDPDLAQHIYDTAQ